MVHIEVLRTGGVSSTKKVFVQCGEIKSSLVDRKKAVEQLEIPAADDAASLAVDARALGCAVSAAWIRFLQQERKTGRYSV